jgi:hypothetical protein
MPHLNGARNRKVISLFIQQLCSLGNTELYRTVSHRSASKTEHSGYSMSARQRIQVNIRMYSPFLSQL